MSMLVNKIISCEPNQQTEGMVTKQAQEGTVGLLRLLDCQPASLLFLDVSSWWLRANTESLKINPSMVQIKMNESVNKSSIKHCLRRWVSYDNDLSCHVLLA